MKKVVVFLMSVIVFVGLFVGCGLKPPASTSESSSSSPNETSSSSSSVSVSESVSESTVESTTSENTNTSTSENTSVEEPEEVFPQAKEYTIVVKGVEKTYTLEWYKREEDGSLYAIGKVDGVEDSIIWSTDASDIESIDVTTLTGEKKITEKIVDFYSFVLEKGPKKEHTDCAIKVGSVEKIYTFEWCIREEISSFYAIGKVDGVEDGIIWWSTDASDIESIDVTTLMGEKKVTDKIVDSYSFVLEEGPKKEYTEVGPF